MARPREQLPWLNIPQNLSMQQPVGGQGVFSPALPTSLQQGFHPPYPMHDSLQTPMQAFFIPQAPSAPGRPTHQSNASVAQLTAAGIHPLNAFTPVTGHFPRPSVMLGPPPPFVGQQSSGHPFPNRSRRQPSIGGPPKAVLGGPSRKLSPLPTVAVVPMAASPAPQKVKKVIVNFPKETVPGEDGQPPKRPSWARLPLVKNFVYHDQDVPPVDLQTKELFPPDSWRFDMPDTVDVFLPGKLAWDAIKQQAIEAKLEKLGVERGSGSNIPFIHAPHARAASISSPADPALLFFKLNKLQQSLDVSSAGNSVSNSPQPLFGLSPPPRSRFVTNRHGHTMSLAQPPSYRPPFFDAPPLVFNPFGPNATLASDQDVPENSVHSAVTESIHAPQGRIPVAMASLAPPPLSAFPRSDSRPDFIRGFGLDIPEEEEEEVHQDEVQKDGAGDATQDMELEEGGTNEVVDFDGASTTAPHSRLHSRHVSRLSAALSLRSVGGNLNAIFGEDDAVQDYGATHPEQHVGRNDVDVEDAIGEWTGSEDVYLGNESSDNESIGEWSNPSDEERARRERVRRRMNRTTAQQLDQPRRIPNFPRPPENTMMFSSCRDDDMVSNPSEENLVLQSQTGFLRKSGLSPLPHSRVASAQYSLHDPAMAHSRIPSENFEYPNITNHQSQPSLGRRDSLNPFAKPFVFGKPLESSGSGSWEGNSGAPNAPLLSHSRLPSFGKPLNVAAPEFKPGGFTFRPPAGVPQMPAPATGFPQDPIAPVENPEGSPFKVQGREKRQRRSSSGSMEEGDSMSSFRFPPNSESPRDIRHTTSVSGSRHKLNPSAEPFTFAGFSAVATLPYVPKAVNQQDAAPEHAEEIFNDDSTTKAEENEDNQTQDLNIPSAAKPKRAPIPLDFKHPVSSNTVPAGLFKALVNNGDERTRRAVRSRLSSREIFDHLSRPSMDDIHVPSIAQQGSRSRHVTDPGDRPNSAGDEDIFASRRTTHTRRRSSLPDALHDDNSSVSGVSVAPQDLTARMEMHKIEHVLGQLLDEKLTALRQDLSKREQNGTQGLAPTTEAMIADVVSLFRTQLQESAGRSLEDSQMDARGEMDFELIKDVVEEGHREILSVLKAQLQELVERLSNRPAGNSIQDIVPIVEQVGSNTTQAVIEAISEFSVRQETIGRANPARERDALMEQLVSVLNPMLTSMQTDPIDYEFLTTRLTQAVKPHISQLIDLASDKRETAGLIVDRILPLLPNSTVDTDAITLQLIAEVRRAIAPIDAFEIKEQVADLVVERLDSRLAVRDKAFNIDTVTGKVTNGMAGLLEPLQRVPATLDQVVASQDALTTQQNELSTLHDTIATALSELPSQLDSCMATLQTTQQNIFAKLEAGNISASQPNDGITELKSTVEGLSANYQALNHGNDELIAMHKQVLDKITVLPDALSTNMNAVHKSLAEMITSRDNSKREVDELRKLNNDYQVQLTKARAAHGQVRVEKDVLNEKLGVVEGERDHLKVQVAELQSSTKARAAETVTLDSRNSELEEALSKALARLQSSDVATQANQQRIADLEKINRDLAADKQASKSKVESMELQVTFASRDKESAVQALEALQKQHDTLTSQQTHWDDLRHASEKIDMLTNLIGQADNDELKELRRHRERSKALEGEHTALQKRFKDLEVKVSNSERASTAARQSLAQAQQRSAEWERRAKEYEGQLEMTQTKLDQAEQTQAQLDADYSLMKLQFEEREADDRLAKDRENKMRDQMSALESKVRNLQTELLEAKTSKAPIPNRNITNGNSHPQPRPDSRASTIYDGRSITPSRRISTYSTTSGRTNTPPQASVWQSMHAPTDTNIDSKHVTSSASIHAPKSRYPHLGPSTPKARRPAYPSYHRAAAPSPTPSAVSAAPTLGDDGWYS